MTFLGAQYTTAIRCRGNCVKQYLGFPSRTVISHKNRKISHLLQHRREMKTKFIMPTPKESRMFSIQFKGNEQNIFIQGASLKITIIRTEEFLSLEKNP